MSSSPIGKSRTESGAQIDATGVLFCNVFAGYVSHEYDDAEADCEKNVVTLLSRAQL